MPRTARNIVEYSVGVTTYIAQFEHQHAKDGKGLTVDGVRGLKHVTSIRLYEKANPRVYIKAKSLCSKHDTYNWKVGIKRALHAALVKSGLKKRTPGEEPSAQTILYGKHMNAFYTELRIKAYGPKATEGGPAVDAHADSLTFIPREESIHAEILPAYRFGLGFGERS